MRKSEGHPLPELVRSGNGGAGEGRLKIMLFDIVFVIVVKIAEVNPRTIQVGLDLTNVVFVMGLRLVLNLVIVLLFFFV